MSDKKSARWGSLPDNLTDRVIEQGMLMIEATPNMDKVNELMNQKTVKPSKFHNKKVEYDGHKFDSIKEKDYYIKLQLMMKAGELNTFVLQPKYYYDVEYSRSEHAVSFTKRYFYKADFEVIYSDGHVETVDVKGAWKGGQTRTFRTKKMIIEKLYGIKIVIV